MTERATAGEVIIEPDVPALMRDGVTLRANVYRPRCPGSYPVLLNRTPYGKDSIEATSSVGLDPVQAARRGFIVAIQDTRGRFTSDGSWDPFRFEGQDGYDSVEWAAQLADSSGRVGMYGGSYHGNTQWLAAMAQPPSLAAISPAFTWSEPMDGLFARGGAVELGLALVWALGTGLDLERLGLSDDVLRRQVDGIIDELDQLGEEGYWALPVECGQALRRHGVLDVGALRVLSNPAIANWSRVSDGWESVEIPSFHTAGWYDIFLQGTLDNYVAMTKRGRDARLIVGPWTHEGFFDPIGEKIFGFRAARDSGEVGSQGGWNEVQLAWFQQHLDPDSTTVAPEAPVRIFVMGRNEWRDECVWPPAGAVSKRWFMRADGSLGPASPSADEPTSDFIYDPQNPVPTVGGNGVLWPGYPSGPFNQAAIEARDDVLVFTSDPLVTDLEAIGRVRVVLHAESSAASTDWVARLCDVHPDGRSINLCDGILRVNMMRGLARYEIDLWSVGNVFLRGHRLRVHVTSSSFPRWDRNLNTGNQRDSHTAIARQVLHHSTDYPCYVELPVIETGPR
jgi:putative CocE/NonD family hydrolase